MNVTVNLPAETVNKLREKAAQNGTTLEEYLESIALECADTNGALPTQAAAKDKSAEQWEKEWRAWAASHRSLSTLADDSRQSIYAERGE